MLSVVNKLILMCQENKNTVYKHAACIIKGQKPITFSNNIDRAYIHGKLCCSGHAEQMAIINHFGGRLKWNGRRWYYGDIHNKKPLKKHKLLVIRINNEGNIVNSAPCNECINLMRFTGLNKINYSNQDGQIINTKIDDLEGYDTKSFIFFKSEQSRSKL